MSRVRDREATTPTTDHGHAHHDMHDTDEAARHDWNERMRNPIVRRGCFCTSTCVANSIGGSIEEQALTLARDEQGVFVCEPAEKPLPTPRARPPSGWKAPTCGATDP